jgi:hypothetical protein
MVTGDVGELVQKSAGVGDHHEPNARKHRRARAAIEPPGPTFEDDGGEVASSKT